MDRIQASRAFYADMITANAGIPRTESRLCAAFASIPRERFLGPGPWKCSTPQGYVETPSDDPALLYQDITVAISVDPPINNGQPSLHALCLGALNVQATDVAIHIGAGTGYYTAILARLAGSVRAFEIDPALAAKAARNLADQSNVTVEARSGTHCPLPACDCIYVSAGLTDPPDAWLDALRRGGRLLFPMTPDQGFGAMLLVTRERGEVFSAKFLVQAKFIDCAGAREESTAKELSRAFDERSMREVRSLHRHTGPDRTSWCVGKGWWLSTTPVEG